MLLLAGKNSTSNIESKINRSPTVRCQGWPHLDNATAGIQRLCWNAPTISSHCCMILPPKDGNLEEAKKHTWSVWPKNVPNRLLKPSGIRCQDDYRLRIMWWNKSEDGCQGHRIERILWENNTTDEQMIRWSTGERYELKAKIAAGSNTDTALTGAICSRSGNAEYRIAVLSQIFTLPRHWRGWKHLLSL